MHLKILSMEEAWPVVKDVDNVTYSQEFFDFQKARYNLVSSFLGVYKNEELSSMLPINYTANKKQAYSVFKEYTEPFFLKKEDVNWKEVANLAKKQLGFESFEINIMTSGNLENSKLSAFIFTLDKAEGDLIEHIQKREIRTAVRKSMKSNFIEKQLGMKDLDVIYQFYLENMKRHATPPKPIEYFRDFFNAYGKKAVALGIFDGSVLAGLDIFVIHNKYLRFHFIFSKVEYWSQRINDLLYYKMIEFGHNHGVNFFDFGPTSNKDTSHINFKLWFGAKRYAISNLTASSKYYLLKRWIAEKKYNLRIRIKRLMTRK